MTKIWIVNWHFQSRITLWCRHKSINVSMGLCWQMPKFIVWCLWSIYFDHHLPLKPSIGKRRKQSCTPNNIPTTLLIAALDKKWDLISKNCKFPKKEFLGTVKLVLDSSYFSFDGQLYRQKFGISMSSPLSSIVQ